MGSITKPLINALIITASLALASCTAETDPGPGGVNAGDAKALDENARQLDERQTNPGKDRVKPE
jgi:hypothetical protein